MSYPYVLFDWDGCLAATLEPWLRSFRTGLERFGLSADERAIVAQFAEQWDLSQVGLAEHQHDDFFTEIQALFSAELPGVQLYPGAGELVGDLAAAGRRLALVTSSPRESLDPLLSRVDLASCFDVLITADETVRHKPHPESVLRALDALGASPEQAVLVGDSGRDLGAARNAGIDSILVFPTAHQKIYELDMLRGYEPTFICESFAEVREVLTPAGARPPEPSAARAR